MTFRQRAARLLAVAALAAAGAGIVVGTQLTLRDPVWPERGGVDGLLTTWALFFAYALPIAIAVGLVLDYLVRPAMMRMAFTGLAVTAVTGTLVGLVVYLCVAKAIGEPIRSPADLLAGLVAGALAGVGWWFAVQRYEEKALLNG